MTGRSEPRDLLWPRAALLSVSDKSGAAEFARALAENGTRILASGGTAQHLMSAGISVTPVEDWTGVPELIGGRVKTLHPYVHGPILARREEADDLAALAELGLEPIDLVAVTLYPFEERAGSLDEAGAVEEIDIGGVALLRAAAKNFAHVIALHSPSQYEAVLEALRRGGPTRDEKRAWALEVFARTSRYDAAIAADLTRRTARPELEEDGPDEPPPVHVIALERVRSLRYGENPHQPAALYTRAGDPGALHALREGKELSYNNLLDLEAAVSLVWRFWTPACVIVKHSQPCGAACGDAPAEAYAAALRSDEQSAYGGIVAFNRALDVESAHALTRQFVECVAAPEFAPEALEVLSVKKNLRTVRLSLDDVSARDSWQVRLVGRWALLQYEPRTPAPEWKVVTRRAPTDDERAALQFAWEVVGAARSNAIALARGTALIGLGSGQTSRVDAVDVALMKAKRSGHTIERAVLASDGFFPFADNIEHAAAAGIRAVVQPGGSMRDSEVVAACDAHGMAMCFTDRRVFRH
jgi:phosphoribosylaminoimidazolecarboxamide formyltransferase/IMP cyclohydrolase